MKPYYENAGIKLYQGDVIDRLREMPDESVNCVVTSPPYWGLRDYGVDGQIGLEPTPAAYLERMVAVFREVRRVLRDDGTCWVNMGDGYCSTAPGTRNAPMPKGSEKNAAEWANWRPETPTGLKPKDLIGMPWRLAFALQAAGWWLRQDIIWSKPNPMPESVTDRCTKAHEYVFLLTKSARYYFDQEAIKEPSVTGDERRPYTSEGAWEMDGRPDDQRHGGEPRSFKGSQFNTGKTATHQLGRASAKPRTAGNKSHKLVTEYEQSDSEEHRTAAGLMKIADTPFSSRNKRSVWEIGTEPYAEAHFATFPTKLVEPCIRAGCPKGGTVLDPFNGSGTTGLVAIAERCNYIGIELKPEYAAMSARRFDAATAQNRFTFGD